MGMQPARALISLILVMQVLLIANASADKGRTDLTNRLARMRLAAKAPKPPARPLTRPPAPVARVAHPAPPANGPCFDLKDSCQTDRDCNVVGAMFCMKTCGMC